MNRGAKDGAERNAANALMERYASGDDSAFSELYDYVAPRLYSFLLRQARDQARAEDLVQQTLLQMHCARRHFTPGAEVIPWAFSIARRLFIDSIRKRKHEVLMSTEEEERASTDPPSSIDLPDELFASKQLAGRIQRELDRMPEAHRVAFELVRQEGLSMAEAAEVLGTTVAAVKLRAHRSYEALRLALGDAIGEARGGPA
jgi:RNA polymerase sigma-70 factor (ECF subfamily)